MWQAGAFQLECGLFVKAIVGEGRVWVFGQRGCTGTAGGTVGDGGLCADDGGRAVDFAEMGERDLIWRALAMQPGWHEMRVVGGRPGLDEAKLAGLG